MLPVKLGTGFPAASSAVTWTAGLIVAPATVVLGCCVNASWVAVPGVMSNAVLVTGANPPALAVSRSEERRVRRDKSTNVATPPTAAHGDDPPSVGLAGYVHS